MELAKLNEELGVSNGWGGGRYQLQPLRNKGRQGCCRNQRRHAQEDALPFKHCSCISCLCKEGTQPWPDPSGGKWIPGGSKPRT